MRKAHATTDLFDTEALKADRMASIAQQTVDYLYKIDGDPTPTQAQAIRQLRQLINEEFVVKGIQVSSQLIYDMLKDVLVNTDGGNAKQ